MREDPDVVMVDSAPAGDGGACPSSHADVGESNGACPGGRSSTADDDEYLAPLRIRRSRSTTVAERIMEGGGGGLPPVARVTVPCPPSVAPKKRKLGVLLRPGAAPVGCVFLFFFRV